MELSARAQRYKQQKDLLNNSLKSRKNRKSLSFKKNIGNEIGPTQKCKRKSSQNKNSNLPNILGVTSSPIKKCKEKDVRLSATPHTQAEKLDNSLKSKCGRKPLVCKKNIVHEVQFLRRSKRKSSIVKVTLNETLEAGSVRRSKRKSCVLNKTCETECVSKSKRKSSMQKKNLNETLKVIPFTSTPIRDCHVSVQKLNDESFIAYNSRSKKQKNCDKTSTLKSPKDSTSCTLSVTLRHRRQTSCISETHALESTKRFKRPPGKGNPIHKREVNYKSFAGTASIDDLALSVIKVRKAKSEGYKIPAKNTLKRRRFLFNELNKADEDYEDDIYESQTFDIFKSIHFDSDSDLSMLSIATPKLGVHVTPMIRKGTPLFRDCISPTEYAINRKVAEECQYRLKKWKNASSASEKTPVPEKKKLEFSQVLTGIQQKEKTIKKIIEGETSELENSYFSDCSRLSEKIHE